MNAKCEVCRHGAKSMVIISKRTVCMICLEKLLKGKHFLLGGPYNSGDVYVFLNDDRTLGYQNGAVPYSHIPKEVTVPIVCAEKGKLPAIVPPAPSFEDSGNVELPDLSKMDKRSREYKAAVKAQQLQPA